MPRNCIYLFPCLRECSKMFFRLVSAFYMCYYTTEFGMLHARSLRITASFASSLDNAAVPKFLKNMVTGNNGK